MRQARFRADRSAIAIDQLLLRVRLRCGDGHLREIGHGCHDFWQIPPSRQIAAGHTQPNPLAQAAQRGLQIDRLLSQFPVNEILHFGARKRPIPEAEKCANAAGIVADNSASEVAEQTHALDDRRKISHCSKET